MRRSWTTVAALAIAGVLLGLQLAQSLYLADRFANHAEVADAEITETLQTGCLGAIGMPGTGPGTTVWRVTFPHAGGRHVTTVSRPCNVVPPDFGRGRGAVWIEYDVDNPDLNRVVNDRGAETAVTWLSVGAVAYLGVLAGFAWRWRSGARAAPDQR